MRLKFTSMHYALGIPLGIVLSIIVWQFILQHIAPMPAICRSLDPTVYQYMDGIGGALTRALFGC